MEHSCDDLDVRESRAPIIEAAASELSRAGVVERRFWRGNHGEPDESGGRHESGLLDGTPPSAGGARLGPWIGVRVERSPGNPLGGDLG